jgi:8-oxo-dGTP pyrophosphatase MutT (NUDIX family)
MNTRVAGFMQREGRVLMVNHVKDGRSYWLLPGGGLKTGEYTSDALKREFLEELKLQIAPGPLLFVLESSSPDNSRFIQPTFRVEPVGGLEIVTGGDQRVAGHGFFGPGDIEDSVIYPDIGKELVSLLTSGTVTSRYVYRKWLD